MPCFWVPQQLGQSAPKRGKWKLQVAMNKPQFSSSSAADADESSLPPVCNGIVVAWFEYTFHSAMREEAILIDAECVSLLVPAAAYPAAATE